MKTKNLVSYGTLAILAILVLAITGFIKVPGALSAGGTTTIGTNGGTTTIATAPCGQNPPVLTFKSYYVDTNNASAKTAATTAQRLYMKGESIPFYSSAATSVNSTTANLLACGDVITVVYGNATEVVGTATGFYKKCVDVTVTKDAQSVEAELYRVAAATFTIANNTGTYGVLAEVDNESIGSGGTYSQITGKVTAPATAGSVFGSDGWGICARFNSSAFQKVWPAGGVAVSVGSVRSTSTKDTVQCYDMSSLGKLELQKYYTFGISVQAASGTVPANSSTIDYILVDKSASQFGSECKVGFASYTDPTADTGAADVVNTNYTRVHSDD